MGCLTRSHEASSALRLTGSTGGCPKLSLRVDSFEQILVGHHSEVKIVSVTASPAGPGIDGVRRSCAGPALGVEE